MKRYPAAVQYAQEMRLCSSPIRRRAAVLLVALAWSSLAFCGEIHQAARIGDLAKVEALLKDNPDLVFAKDKGGDTRRWFHPACILWRQFKAARDSRLLRRTRIQTA